MKDISFLLHPDPMIEFNESIAKTTFTILSEIVKYSADNNILF